MELFLILILLQTNVEEKTTEKIWTFDSGLNHHRLDIIMQKSRKAVKSNQSQ